MKLELRSICVQLGGKTILDKIDLSVPAHTFVTLLGPSGCGKSTLIKTIAGILPQASGQVWIEGVCADKLPVHKRGTAVVFQDIRLFPHMTAIENVAFPLKMQGMPRQERLKSAAYLLAHVQLEGLGDRKAHQLSGGQQQRVALARALAARPNVLLLDEPFYGLDELLRDSMRKLVRKLHDEFHMTTILVTHDRQEALSLSDQIVLMQEGRILQVGTPRTLYEKPISPAVATCFGETTCVSGEVQKGIFSCTLFSCPTEKVDGPYTVALRPHALEVCEGSAFQITRTAYQGTGVVAWCHHEKSGMEVAVSLPPDSPLCPKDKIGIQPILTKLIWI